MKKLTKLLLTLALVLALGVCTALCVSAEGDIAVTRVVGENSQTQYTSAGTFTLWDAPASIDGQFVGWTDGTALYRAGHNYNITTDVTFEAVALDIYMEEGASVRLNAQNSGIRFTTNIGRAGYDFLEEVASELTVGTLIVPTDYIPSGTLTLQTPKAVKILNGTKENISWMGSSKDLTAYRYGGSLVNILPNNYIRNFSGIGYVTVEYADGSSETFYAPYETDNVRSILSVACMAYDDSEKDYLDWQKKIIKGYIDGVVKFDTATNSVIAPDSTNYEVTYQAEMDNGTLTLSAIEGKEWDASAVKCIVVDGKINKNWSLDGNAIKTVVYSIDDADDFGEDIFDDVAIDIKMLAPTMLATGSTGVTYNASIPSAVVSSLDDVSYGMIVVPTASIKTVKSFSHASLDAAVISYVDHSCTASQSDKSMVWSYTKTDFEKANYSTLYTAVGYISYTDDNGNTAYVYASGAKEDKGISAYEAAFIAYESSDYTDTERANIKKYLDDSIVIWLNEEGSASPYVPADVTRSRYSFTYTLSQSGDELTITPQNPVTSGSMWSGYTLTVSNVTIARSYIGDLTATSSGWFSSAPTSVKVSIKFDNIHLNQVGYRSDSVKRAIVTNGGYLFWVKNKDTDEIVYHDAVEQGSYEERAGDTVNYCDFTSITEPGKYIIYVDSIVDDDHHNSYTFEIGNDVYDDVTELLVKCFYYNRCGDQIVDASYGRSACHAGSSGESNKVVVLEWNGDFTYDDSGRKIGSTRTTTQYFYRSELAGGWHDAGDYGRYMTAETTAAAKLLIAYMIYPDAFGDDTGITESGNGVSDILDEVRYTLEWMFKMQRSDGAVYHKLAGSEHADFVVPTSDTKPLYLFPPSVEATADFAGAMAMAHRVFKSIDPTFANNCLNAAISAYNWASANTSLGTYPEKDGSTTGGGNGSNIAIELSFAAEALYMSTGEEDYHDYFCDNIANIDLGSENANTNLRKDSAYMCAVYDYYLNTEGRNVDQSVLSALAQGYSEYTAKRVTNYNGTPYEFSYLNYTYTNMGLISGNAAQILSDMLNGADTRYVIEENVNYVMGKNAIGYCGVLGIGSKQIENPHLRIYTPGWVTGGPCDYAALASRFDLTNETRITADMPPMKCYVDEFDYFYINEPTISANANAVIVFAYMCD